MPRTNIEKSKNNKENQPKKKVGFLLTKIYKSLSFWKTIFMWITKLLLFVLIFAIIYTMKEGGRFGLALLSKSDTYRDKFKYDKWDFIYLACALAYIFTIIFTGFKL